MSNQPLASSPRSLNGTGYGTLNGKNLNEKAALSNWKRIRFPSFIDAAALWHFYGQIVFKQLKKKATEVAFSFDKL